MSQEVFSNIDPNTTSGIQLAAILNNFKDAVMSGMIGPTRPDELTAGGIWVDNSQGASPNFRWRVKLYTGSVDIVLFDINIQNNGITINGTESLFTITKTSDDDISANLRLIKRRIAGTGGVQTGDDIGKVQFYSRNSSMIDNEVAAILVEAIENATNAASGTALSFMATPAGSVTPTEMMRMVNGRLGIGDSNPSDMLHIRGNLRLENRLDDALGRSSIFKKRRATGNGQILANDTIGNISFRSTDQNGAEVTIGRISLNASENTTDVAQGSKLSVYTKEIGSNAETVTASFSGDVTELKRLNLLASIYKTSANNNEDTPVISLPTTPVTRLVNAGLTSLTGITAPLGTMMIECVFINDTGVDIVITNNSSGAGTNRIFTGTGDDVELAAGSSFTAIYDYVSTGWRLMGGSGGGGGGAKKVLGTFAAPILLDGSTIPFSGSQSTLMMFVEGSVAGETPLSGTPRIDNGKKVGQELHLYFTSAANLVSIEDGGNIVTRGAYLSDIHSIIRFLWNGTLWVEQGRN